MIFCEFLPGQKRRQTLQGREKGAILLGRKE
jgi:hypothetical protein